MPDVRSLERHPGYCIQRGKIRKVEGGFAGQKACLTKLLKVKEEVGVDAAHAVAHEQGHEQEAQDPAAAEDDADPPQHSHGAVIWLRPLHVPHIRRGCGGQQGFPHPRFEAVRHPP